jgi:hypothetical protein
VKSLKTLVISFPVASESILAEMRTRHCRVPTILAEMRRQQCRVPTINWGRDTALPSPLYHNCISLVRALKSGVGTRQCRVLYIIRSATGIYMRSVSSPSATWQISFYLFNRTINPSRTFQLSIFQISPRQISPH